jgi:hypothetical protein
MNLVLLVVVASLFLMMNGLQRVGGRWLIDDIASYLHSLWFSAEFKAFLVLVVVELDSLEGASYRYL